VASLVQPHAQGSRQSIDRGSTRQILIVDDVPSNLKLSTLLLVREGYEVSTVSDGREALAVLERLQPRLILMDIKLPGMSGLEVTRLLKADARTRHIPIVALTSCAMNGDEQKARMAGCDGYIARPIDTRTFTMLVKDFVDRGRD
jgi:two-component system cell cycle response regulator DivK